MAKTWYPVVDYQLCTECGTCVTGCSHNVYDKTKEPSPVVILPDECVDHCHGCGNRCPAGAITYVGDDTGWTPPNRTQTAEETACDCGGEEADKKILVEYLYLDLQTCDRCIGTDKVLDEVMNVLTPAFRLAGYRVEYSKKEMKTAEIAIVHRFLASPTIRVNGKDVFQKIEENSCGCCSEISGTDVECRVFEHNGESYEIPKADMLADAILKAAYITEDTGCTCQDYELPDNLKEFFLGKQNKSCDCGGNCS